MPDTLTRILCVERSSWLPLMLGHGTFYVNACPHMSFFLAGGAPRELTPAAAKSTHLLWKGVVPLCAPVIC